MDLFKLVGRIAIENAAANEEIDETTEKAKGLADALDGTSTSAGEVEKKTGKAGKAFGAMSVFMGNVATKVFDASLKVGKFIGKTGFAFNASMEAYENQFSALLGDADKGKQLVEDLNELAKISPLGMEGLASNAISLLNTGTELADLIPTLEMLGNLSLGDTSRMASVTRAYTQIMNKGRLMAQEMYQLSDAGVPILQIMTKYGGKRYEDGSWFEEWQLDPKDFIIPAETFQKAMMAATAEGGIWEDYMFKMMDTWNGQVDRMGEQGKETLGDLMESFFEVAKSDVLPRLTERLDKFGTWVTENKSTIDNLAMATGKLVTEGFDKMLNLFEWMMEHGAATKAALMGIASAMYIGSLAAHPYATAIATIAAGLAYFASTSEKMQHAEVFDKYTAEDLSILQEYVDAYNAMKQAEAASNDDYYNMDKYAAYEEAEAIYAAALERAKAIPGLLGDYQFYNDLNGTNNGVFVDVPIKAAEGSKDALQTEINGYGLEGVLKLNADMTNVYSAVDNAYLSTTLGIGTTGGATGIPGHATGLDRVPRDNYIARLHKDEAVLNSTNAAIWRSGGTVNTGRLEAIMMQLIGLTQQLVANTGASKPVVLDTGVMVGQLAGPMDRQLGIMKNRRR